MLDFQHSLCSGKSLTMSDQDTLAGRPRILIVDDSRIVRATVRKHLAENYGMIEEADGEAGWRRLLADETVSC